jgi:catechol 2,3-dioxygenase-like lactoylglutathione lyase family enzyme
MSAADYGRQLPQFCVNLIVRDVPRSISFYTTVLDAAVHYFDVDFAAIRVLDQELMLHADHAYDGHPWYQTLSSEANRGLGAEMRLFGVDPDEVEARAREADAIIVVPTADKGHGWREVMIADPDGYLWAVGRPN